MSDESLLDAILEATHSLNGMVKESHEVDAPVFLTTTLREYWQAEVTHLEAQKIRVTKLGNVIALEALVSRLRFARQHLNAMEE